MLDRGIRIGRVTRCSTQELVGALRIPEPDLPTFGSYCLVEAQGGQTEIIGLIHDIRIEDDELTRQLAILDELSEEQMADNRENRLVPVEISALTVGYHTRDVFHYTLPPQPPITLSEIFNLTEKGIRAFTDRFDFLPLLLNNSGIPADELVIAAILRAASVRPASERSAYLIEAGKFYTRFMYKDMARVEATLTRFKMGYQTSA